MCRNPLAHYVAGAVGLGIGFGLGLVGRFAAGIIFAVMTAVAGAFVRAKKPDDSLAFLILMMGRAAAWAVVALPPAWGRESRCANEKSFSTASWEQCSAGCLAGCSSTRSASSSLRPTARRARAVQSVSSSSACRWGFLSGWSRDGEDRLAPDAHQPLAGKQFVLHRDITLLGSSPKAEIYLLKRTTPSSRATR